MITISEPDYENEERKLQIKGALQRLRDGTFTEDDYDTICSKAWSGHSMRAILTCMSNMISRLNVLETAPGDKWVPLEASSKKNKKGDKHLSITHEYDGERWQPIGKLKKYKEIEKVLGGYLGGDGGYTGYCRELIGSIEKIVNTEDPDDLEQ